MTDFKAYNFENKKALVRVDFNVPLDDHFHITDDTRIRAAHPTIEKILNDGGSVILCSHFGRPKAGPEDKYSLRHLTAHLSQILERPVLFAKDCIGETTQKMAEALKPGEVLLLENTRFYPEETANDEAFSRQLAALGDVYVNDAFGSAHRAHASTAGVAAFFSTKDRMAGLLMDAEVSNAEKVMKNYDPPFTAILGGAKISGKILIIEQLLNRANHIIIGGGMAYTFVKAKGGSTGASLVEEDRIETALALLEKAEKAGVTIHLPIDTVAADRFANDAQTKLLPIDQIPEGWMGLDIGPQSIATFRRVIEQSKTILWNGPMGVFEMENFCKGTQEIAQSVVNATDLGAYSLVGGGDSVAAINQLGLAERVRYVSTGGGALLEFFEGKILPGIAALQ